MFKQLNIRLILVPTDKMKLRRRTQLGSIFVHYFLYIYVYLYKLWYNTIWNSISTKYEYLYVYHLCLYIVPENLNVSTFLIVSKEIDTNQI